MDYPLPQQVFGTPTGSAATFSAGGTVAHVDFDRQPGDSFCKYPFVLSAPDDLPPESQWADLGIRVELSATGPVGEIVWGLEASNEADAYRLWLFGDPDPPGFDLDGSVRTFTFDLLSDPRVYTQGVQGDADPPGAYEFVRRLTGGTNDTATVTGYIDFTGGDIATVISHRVVLYSSTTPDSAVWYEPPLRQYPRQDDRASMGVRRMWPRTESRRIGHIP